MTPQPPHLAPDGRDFDGTLMTAASWSHQWQRQPIAKHAYTELSVRSYYLRAVLALVNPAELRGRSSLELGCGTGIVSRALYDALGLTRAVLVDFADEAATIARSNVGARNMTVVQADVLNYEPRERFDLVFSIGLVEHFRGQAQQRAVHRHAELLAPAGTVVIIAPRKTLHCLPLMVYNRLRGYREYPVSDRRLAALCRNSGLHIRRRRRPVFGLLTGVAAGRAQPAAF